MPRGDPYSAAGVHAVPSCSLPVNMRSERAWGGQGSIQGLGEGFRPTQQLCLRHEVRVPSVRAPCSEAAGGTGRIASAGTSRLHRTIAQQRPQWRRQWRCDQGRTAGGHSVSAEWRQQT